MRRAPWAIFLISAAATLVAVLATTALKVEPCVSAPGHECPPVGWLTAVALWVRPNALTIILYATLLSLGAQALDKAVGHFGFRRSKAEKFLDEIVRAQFKGAGRHHRLTLFKKAWGPKAKIIAWWRVKRQEDPDGRKREAVRAIGWRGKYLYVYARASKSPNKVSSSVWRVYDHRDGSQGFAGRAWDEGDVVIARDLPKIKPDKLAAVSELSQAPVEVREYARMANITDMAHVRAMRSVAQHYMGVVIETASGEPWGVLLVDSMKDQCPFPKGAQQEKFKKQFRDHATMLSLLLS